jgi:DNA-binding NarL/FixJ family response regulator
MPMSINKDTIPGLPDGFESRERYGTLSERERQVFAFVARGFTAPEIGKTLEISPKTVDTYKHRINEKLQLRQRSDYVVFALKLGVIG